MNFVNANGILHSSDEPVLLAGNRGFRYAEGLFETIKVLKGRMPLGRHHFERLFSGIKLLGFKTPQELNPSKLETELIALATKNNCQELAKARISVSNGNGNLSEQWNELQYIIECTPLSGQANDFNQEGLIIDIYSDARKSQDKLSNLKSSNFLCYSMAANYARSQKLDDCLLLNTSGNIADATIANIFCIKNGNIITPPSQ